MKRDIPSERRRWLGVVLVALACATLFALDWPRPWRVSRAGNRRWLAAVTSSAAV